MRLGYGRSDMFGGLYFSIMGDHPYIEYLDISIATFGSWFSIHGGSHKWFAYLNISKIKFDFEPWYAYVRISIRKRNRENSSLGLNF